VLAKRHQRTRVDPGEAAFLAYRLEKRRHAIVVRPAQQRSEQRISYP
jgi:hypothetical protein